MKLATFYISRTKQIYTKTFIVTVCTCKVKAISPETLVKILLMSAVICKERRFQEHNTVQYLQNWKCQDVNQDHFRKPLQASKNVVKNNYPKAAYTLLMGHSIRSHFLEGK